MSPDRRRFLKLLGGAGTASVAALGAQGVQSQLADIPGGVQPDVAWDDPSKLAADDGDTLDFFGMSAALSRDGRTALIGAQGDDGGSAYAFAWNGSSWNQEAKLTAEDRDSRDEFGSDVDLSATGDTALVTDENDVDPAGATSGSAYIFTRSDGAWSQQAKLVSDDIEGGDSLGKSGALSPDGSMALVGADGDENENGVSAGAVYVYRQSGGSWSQEQKLLVSDGEANDQLGRAISLADDGNLAFVTALGDSRTDDATGSVYVFEQSGGSWSEQTRIVPTDSPDENRFFGASISLTPDGTTMVVGAPGPRFVSSDLSGRIYVFSNSGGSWSQQAQLAHDGGGGLGFGGDVAVSDGGNTILTGTPRDPDPNGNRGGSVTVFTLSDGSWSRERKLSSPDGGRADNFGTAVALAADGEVGLVGAGRDNDPNGDRAGSAYVSGTVPEQSTSTPAPMTPTPGSDQMSGTTTTAPDTEESGTETAGGSGPGFGVLATAASVLTAGYLLRDRLRDGDRSE